MNKVDIKELFKIKQNQMLSNFGLNEAIFHPGTKGDATKKNGEHGLTTIFQKDIVRKKHLLLII